MAMRQFKYDFGDPNTGVADPYKGYNISSTDKSLITSILSAGTFCGALSAGYIADRFGRKVALWLGTLIYTIGVILEIVAPPRDLLIVGRAVAGFGVGFVSSTIIMYITEISPKAKRGSFTGAYQMAITLGLLLAAGV